MSSLTVRPPDQLHDEVDVWLALDDAVDGNDPRVTDGCQHARLSPETIDVLLSIARSAQRFDRDFSVELGVPRAVDLAKAAAAQRLSDLVVLEEITWLEARASLCADQCLAEVTLQGTAGAQEGVVSSWRV